MIGWKCQCGEDSRNGESFEQHRQRTGHGELPGPDDLFRLPTQIVVPELFRGPRWTER